jgi:hypothetical protein
MPSDGSDIEPGEEQFVDFAVFYDSAHSRDGYCQSNLHEICKKTRCFFDTLTGEIQ